MDFKNEFKQYDKNNDGFIDFNELKQIFKEIGDDLSDEKLKKMIELIDKNKDGLIDYEEFLSLKKKYEISEEEKKNLIELFKSYDKDNCGYITSSDLKQVSKEFERFLTGFILFLKKNY
jgi:Ca2+-binding EF-hand superfamily protein